MTDDTAKTVTLIEELALAEQLITLGLQVFQRLDLADDRYHAPMLHLASGYERLLKVTICYRMRELNGEYPTSFPWPRGARGHDLVPLLKWVLDNCFIDSYVESIPVGRQDLCFLRDDRRFRSILKILSDFGIAARYHNLNYVSGQGNITDSPEQEWAKVELKFMRDDPELMDKLGCADAARKVYRDVVRQIVILFERFARGVCRLYTLSEMSQHARQASSVVMPFIAIQDNELGERVYRY